MNGRFHQFPSVEAAFASEDFGAGRDVVEIALNLIVVKVVVRISLRRPDDAKNLAFGHGTGEDAVDRQT